MTITLTIITCVLAAALLTLAGFILYGRWQQKNTTAKARLNLVETVAAQRGQLIVALALMLKDKGGKTSVPKAKLEQATKWAITPQRRPDGGIDLPLTQQPKPKAD